MARVATIIAFQFIILALLAFFAVGEDQDFARTLDQYELLQGHLKKQKLTHFRVYWHDIYTGPNPTAMNIVRPPSNTSATHFGSLSMFDDPLTQGPELSSKLVGRAQGFYGSASQQEFSLLMATNFVFLEGKYNGSTITILGRDEVFLKTREMPIIGGTGIFRFARGYVQVRTIKVDLNTADGVAEYNVYVLHY